jgi:di/tricarboxylate transporter
LIYDTGVELREAKPIEEGNGSTQRQQPTNLWEDLKARINSDDIDTIEVVVSPDSLMVGKTARTLNLRERYGVNLLAISRYNESLRRPVGSTPFRPGDVLLLQTHHQHLSEALHDLGCLPLAERELNLEPRNLILGIGIFVAALVTASLNILPVPTAMMSAAIAMVMTGVLNLREAYRSVQWPIVILLGSMLSLGVALEQTGGDQLIANQILKASSFASPAILLVAIMLATMMLSDIVNNAASVVLMASIAVNVARGLGVSLDPFLVAVAVGGACAFLTPVGHEANVLVFDVGGYEFGDYWRLGLPLELLITAVTVPILLLLWPL